MLPTALLESLPTLLEREVEPGRAAETSAAAVSDGLDDAKGGGSGDEACPDPLPLCHHGVGKVHAGEGGNYLLRLCRRRPQPIK